MNINGLYKVRNVLIATVLSTAAGCATVNSPVHSDTHKPTPQELADRATKLLQELAQLGQHIDAEQYSDGIFRLVCGPAQCSGPVPPNGVGVNPIPKPVPPLLATDVLKTIAFVAAINQMAVPAMNFEKATVTIQYSAVVP